MKRPLTIVFRVCLLAYIVMLFTSCSCKKHKHNYEKSWSMNETHHFHKCTGCEEIIDKEEHKWNNGVVTKESTDATEGEKKYICTVCKATKIEHIDKTPNVHEFSKEWTSDEIYHWYKCMGCDMIKNKEEHSWDCGVITKKPTDTTDGEKTYTCTICKKTKIDEMVASKGLEFTLSITEDSYIVTGIGICEDNDIIIPAIYNGLPVTSIGEKAFYECKNITSIVIPDGVTSIQTRAFDFCVSLTSIEMPDTVTSIQYEAFGGCFDLKNIVIPYGVTIIEEYTFSGCNRLISVEIPNSVTSIGDYAFASCMNLTSITLPSSVTSIGYGAFMDCYRLNSIKIPNSVTSIGNRAFCECHDLTSIEIPNSVTSIGDDAFEECYNLQYNIYKNCKYLGNKTNPYVVLITVIDTTAMELTIHKNTRCIYNSAIWSCSNLTSIEIPNRVTCIGKRAFCDCRYLTSIEIPNSVTSIGESAFEGCGELPYNEYGNCKYLGNKENPYLVLIRVEDTSVSDVKINENTRFICNSAFYECRNLTSIDIPDSVTSIGDSAFRGCKKLINVVIGSSVTSIGSYEFYECDNLTNVVMGNSVTSIGWGAFYGCSSLTSIVIPNSVTRIGSYAFYKCSNLTSIFIGNSVTDIDAYAFDNCTSLTSIVIPNSVARIGWKALSGCINITIYCELNSKPCNWKIDWNDSNRPVYWLGEWEYVDGVPTPKNK